MTRVPLSVVVLKVSRRVPTLGTTSRVEADGGMEWGGSRELWLLGGLGVIEVRTLEGTRWYPLCDVQEMVPAPDGVSEGAAGGTPGRGVAANSTAGLAAGAAGAPVQPGTAPAGNLPSTVPGVAGRPKRR